MSVRSKMPTPSSEGFPEVGEQENASMCDSSISVESIGERSFSYREHTEQSGLRAIGRSREGSCLGR